MSVAFARNHQIEKEIVLYKCASGCIIKAH